MAYVTGFLAPVPTARKEDYRKHAESAWPMFERYGALAMRECWGVDVPDGKVTSFPMAVKKEDDETVVFSWIEWPDKDAADRCFRAMEAGEAGEEMASMQEMPFDGMRLMWGGFEDLLAMAARQPA